MVRDKVKGEEDNEKLIKRLEEKERRAERKMILKSEEWHKRKKKMHEKYVQ